jgi:hypothetical protein
VSGSAGEADQNQQPGIAPTTSAFVCHVVSRPAATSHDYV